MNIIHAIQKKGIVKSMERGLQMFDRYGLNDKNMRDNMTLYNQIMKDYNIKATIFVPIIIWNKYKDFLIKLDNLEFAVHGYEHIDYCKATELEIESQLNECDLAIKESNGRLLAGWRSPYLQINDKLFTELNEHGFKFESSKTTITNGLVIENDSYRLIKKIYNPQQKNKPYTVKGILEIPLTLPDDEMLLDRLNLSPETIGRIWLNMSLLNPLYILQLHPERVNILQGALKQLITETKVKDIPIVPLSEINKTTKNALCITGDLDRMRL